MFLHNDEELFKDVIIAASVDQKRPVAIVEKDYYVTMILKLLAQVEPGCVFKGGTSLSKCHHVIDRFSEDIDITFSNTLTQGKCRFRVHQKSVEKMKNKIRELTDRNKGISNEVRERKYQEYVRGWVEYFKLADMKGLLKETDEWARRRIRAVYWKQWKKIKTKYRMLKALGMEHWKAKELACSRKGYWRMAKVLNQIFSKKIIAKLGYSSMLDYYLVVCEN